MNNNHPINKQKIMHWIRHDNALAWERFANTIVGQKNLVDTNLWIGLIWRAKAWKILEVWSTIDQHLVEKIVEKNNKFNLDETLSVLTNASKIEEKHTFKKHKNPSLKNAWAFYKKICFQTKDNGWTPSGYWGWSLTNWVKDNVLPDEIEWAKPLLLCIPPSSPISAVVKDNTQPIVWLDWLLITPFLWAEDIFWSLLRFNPTECQAVHKDWTEFIFNEKIFVDNNGGNLLFSRVAEALNKGFLLARVPEEHVLKKIITLYEKTQREHSEKTQETTKLLSMWAEREKLLKKEQAVLDNYTRKDFLTVL